MFSLVSTLACTTEYDALLAIYDANGGDEWTGAASWGTQVSHCDWEGVTCNAGGYVIELNLTGFGLTGQLSDQIGCFPFLKTLWLNNNSLTSTVPEAICGLTNLQILQANGAGLTGAIPECMCTMTHLQFWYMDFNTLSGEIPSCVGNLTFLREAHLKCNSLTGAVPAGFEGLQFLVELRVNCNSGLDCASGLASRSNFIFLCGDVGCEDCAITPSTCPAFVDVQDCGRYYRVSP